MSKPLTVTIAHKLGKEEAVRRLKAGLGTVRTKFGQFLRIEEETWIGDEMTFRVAALGQSAWGTIEVFESEAKLEVHLPWLFQKLAERAQGLIRKEGRLMLEKKP